MSNAKHSKTINHTAYHGQHTMSLYQLTVTMIYCNDDDILYNKSQKYTMTSLRGAGGSHSGLADIRCVHSMPPLLFSE